jgi:mono/diheme cytochrome c family protein
MECALKIPAPSYKVLVAMGKSAALALVIAAAISALGGYLYVSAPEGGEIFVRENCVKCHKLRGRGLGVIDLSGVVEERGRAWVRDQITRPRAHEPNPGMPSFAHLSHREVEALVDYIEGGE